MSEPTPDTLAALLKRLYEYRITPTTVHHELTGMSGEPALNISVKRPDGSGGRLPDGEAYKFEGEAWYRPIEVADLLRALQASSEAPRAEIEALIETLRDEARKAVACANLGEPDTEAEGTYIGQASAFGLAAQWLEAALQASSEAPHAEIEALVKKAWAAGWLARAHSCGKPLGTVIADKSVLLKRDVDRLLTALASPGGQGRETK